MDISVITELESRNTHWTRLYIIGIRSEAKRAGINLFEVVTDGSSIPEEGFKCKTAIVLGQSSEWICGICTALLKRDIKPVVAGSAGKRRFGAAGCVLMDYETAVTQLLDYFNACGRKRVALFSVSDASPHDTHKTDAFLHYKGGCYTHNDIFYYRGLTLATCEAFIADYRRYDAVIGTNDVSSSILMRMLSQHRIRVPEDIFIASFGDTNFAKNATNRITLATLNLSDVGIYAVRMCRTLTENPEISNSTIALRCSIDVRESTANIPFSIAETMPETEPVSPYDYYKDPHVNEVLLAESVLSMCDPLDFEIIKSVTAGQRYADMAEKLHVSENTVKYRIKRILVACNLASRKELSAIMKAYLT